MGCPDTTTANLGLATYTVSPTAGTAAAWVVDNFELIDAAITNYENDFVLLETLTASGSTSLDFTAFDDTLYSSYKFVIEGLLPSATGQYLGVRVSVNGGSTFISSNSYYGYGLVFFNASYTFFGGLPTGIFLLSRNNIGIAAGDIGISGSVDLSVGASDTAFTAHTTHRNGSTYDGFVGGGQYGAPIDGLRFLFIGATITSGTVRMYGLRKS